MLDFDVQTLNDYAYQAKKSKLRWLLGMTIFAIAFGLFFVALDWGALLNRTLSLLGLITLLLVLAIVGLMLFALAPGFPLTRRGAGLLKVHDDGIDFWVTSDRVVPVKWDDPKLEIELLDFSRVPQRNPTTDIRYVIRIARLETALSREAFDWVITEATHHRLSVSRSRASLWIYPASIAPTVYHVRATSRSRAASR